MVTSDFKGPYRWMAPEVFDTNNEGWLNIPTRESDVFALGMVTFEVRNVHLGRLFRGLNLPSGVHRTSAVPRG